jgi:aspartate racemase
MGPDRMLGILGGMGPLATADFFHELVLATPAENDAGQIPVVLSSVPQIPDRVGPIMTGSGPSPLPALIAERHRLVAAGARCIAMPCNTAHYWIKELREGSPVPFLSIIDAALDAVRASGAKTLGLLGTTATLHAGFYQRTLKDAGFQVVVPSEHDQAECVSVAIALVKKGRITEARRLFHDVIAKLESAGATATLLACTEVPAALRDDPAWLAGHCIDATSALAAAAVRWAFNR